MTEMTTVVATMSRPFIFDAAVLQKTELYYSFVCTVYECRYTAHQPVLSDILCFGMFTVANSFNKA